MVNTLYNSPKVPSPKVLTISSEMKKSRVGEKVWGRKGVGK